MVPTTRTKITANMTAYSAMSYFQLVLFLKPEQMGRLQELSQITGAPVAELIRRAIDAYLEQRKKEFGRG
jgi:ribbon-helix-helix protein